MIGMCKWCGLFQNNGKNRKTEGAICLIERFNLKSEFLVNSRIHSFSMNFSRIFKFKGFCSRKCFFRNCILINDLLSINKKQQFIRAVNITTKQ